MDLNIVNLKGVAIENIREYLINNNEQKAIKIPVKILKTLGKFSTNITQSDTDKRNLAANILAFAILYKNIASDFKARNAFSKFLKTSLMSELFNGYFTVIEVQDLISFFRDCPSGYKLESSLVWANIELKPMIT